MFTNVATNTVKGGESVVQDATLLKAWGSAKRLCNALSTAV